MITYCMRCHASWCQSYERHVIIGFCSQLVLAIGPVCTLRVHILCYPCRAPAGLSCIQCYSICLNVCQLFDRVFVSHLKVRLRPELSLGPDLAVREILGCAPTQNWKARCAVLMLIYGRPWPNTRVVRTRNKASLLIHVMLFVIPV